MLANEYMFPYGAMKVVDPLIGVETEHGWIKQRLCNLTDFYLVTSKDGTDSVIDVTRTQFYVNENQLGSLSVYAQVHLRDFFEWVGVTMHVYEVKK